MSTTTRHRLVGAVALVLALSFITGCEPPDTVGIDVDGPPPTFTATELQDLTDWVRNASPCATCGAADDTALAYTWTTPFGTGNCSFWTCTLVINVVVTRLIASTGSIPSALAAAGVAKASWIAAAMAAFDTYVIYIATNAVNRDPDGCLAYRFINFPISGVFGEPTWIGHVAAANSKCHHG